AAGRIGVLGGRLAFSPQVVDLLPPPASVHLDIPQQQALVSIPSQTIERVLESLPKIPQLKKAGPLVVKPHITWLGNNRFELGAGLVIGKETFSLAAQGQLAVSSDARLRLGLKDLHIDLGDAVVDVSLDKRIARASIPLATVQRDAASFLSGLHNVEARWLAPAMLQISGELDPAKSTSKKPTKVNDLSAAGVRAPRLSLAIPPAARALMEKWSAPGQKARLTIATALAAQDGKVVARINNVEFKGANFQVLARPQEGTASIMVSPDLLRQMLQRVAGAWGEIQQLRWTKPNNWRLAGTLGERAWEAGGTMAVTAQGKLVLDINSLRLQQGVGKIAVQPDLASGRVQVTLPETLLPTILRSAQLPLERPVLKVLAGNRLEASGRYRIWGIPLPIRTSGSLALGGEGDTARYTIDSAWTGKLPVMGIMKRFGLTFARIASKNPNSWEGNTYTTQKLRIPPGLKLTGFTKRQGAVEATLQLASNLTAKLYGVQLTANRITVDPQTLLALPGSLRSVQADETGLALTLGLDRQKLQSYVKTAPGISFDGAALYATPEAIARRSVPIKLLALSGDTKGVTALFALKPALFEPLKRLPPGISFDGTGFRIDPKQGKPVPGRLTAVKGDATGLKLRFALSREELARSWKVSRQGVAWDGQAITFDTAALPGGARATGAVVKEGNLEVELGDRSLLPSPGADPEIRFEGKGPIRVKGFLADRLSAILRPRRPDLPLSLDKLTDAAIEVTAGRIVVTPAALDQALRKKLGADYDKLAPRFDGRRLIVRTPAWLGHLPMALRFEKTTDGKLQLVPSGLFGQYRVAEFPQRAIGLLLSPLSFLLPRSNNRQVDLQEAAGGVKLPPLAGVMAKPEGLILDFGKQQ
ncbi:MAG: hypothetical protein HY692_00785, partial [Cyanobacteria bacterium NC_groundwater_1444_Ag_S-0.65um_54_12]|nr:hypothetical protein [Cyanobacteria bacterium NC_groundwater_1444_Ag_S-0.65um_54_12]